MTQERVFRWIGVLRRHVWWLMIPAVIIASAALFAASRDGATTYQAKTILYAQSQLPSASSNLQNQTEDWGPFLRAQAQLAKSSGVLTKAAAAAGNTSGSDLRGSISTSTDGASNTLTLSAVSASPGRAISVANTVAQTLSETGLQELAARLKVRSADLQRQIDRLDQTVQKLNADLLAARSSLQDTTTIEARRNTATNQYGSLVSSQQELLNEVALQRAPLAILEPASKAERTARPSLPLRGVLGALIGLVLGAAALWIRQLLDDTVRRVEQVEELIDAPLLAELPSEKLRRGSTLPTLDHPSGGLAESFRGLRTALKFVDHGERLRSFAIVSSEPRDGKTFTAANLAISFAQAGAEVCVVSADLRNPALDSVFGVADLPGLAELLGEPTSRDEVPVIEITRYIRSTQVEGLSVLPAGKVPSNPSELLAGFRATLVMAELHQSFDVVIVDSPPLLVADPEIIGDLVDGLVLVVSVNSTRIRRLRRAAERLADSPLRLAGVVVNRTEPSKGYYGPYGSAYSPYTKGSGRGGRTKSESTAATDPVAAGNT